MRRARLALAAALATTFTLSGASFAQDPKIGSAKSTKNNVQGVISGKTQNLSTGSDVFSNETVRTGNAAVVDLVFLDNTNLSVGPISEIRLDKFVYDPTGLNGAVVLQATKGAFRFVTGSQDKRAYEIRTPFGSLRVRGTVVELVLKECAPGTPLSQCGVSLKLVEGQATFTTSNGQTIDLSQANTLLSVDGNGGASTSSRSGSLLNFTVAGTGGDVNGAVGGAGGGGGGTGGGTAGGGGIGGGVALQLGTAAINPIENIPGLSSINGGGESGISRSVSPSTVP
jgi:hypothetical protein